jgi:hypothetical protein
MTAKKSDFFWSDKERESFLKLLNTKFRTGKQLIDAHAHTSGKRRTAHALMGQIQRFQTERKLTPAEAANRLLLNRLIWSLYKKIKQLTTPEGQALAVKAQTAPKTIHTKMYAHSFRLRPDAEIALKLPENLTEKEADRLATFIKTLPTA